eukprot:TRINITY_DN18471_c0_g1_i1.p1 TRINITY_DN18471_c0_g1~~TRINITY_DN18471_c0_g1_i1.p1  ORF type:complete len:121 (+),score=20.35 TRINITY_DN18471_c0_g1_i1:60-422(+)
MADTNPPADMAEIDELSKQLGTFAEGLQEEVAEPGEAHEQEEDEEESGDYEHIIIAVQKYVLKPFVIAFSVALGLSTGYAFFDLVAGFRLRRPRIQAQAPAPPPPSTSFFSRLTGGSSSK